MTLDSPRSLQDWILVRDLLQAGELLEINPRLLKVSPTVRPGKFDLNCFAYIREVEKRLKPLREFDQFLPSRIKQLQDQYGTDLSLMANCILFNVVSIRPQCPKFTGLRAILWNSY